LLFGAIAVRALPILLEWVRASGKQKIKIKTGHTSVEILFGVSKKRLSELLEVVANRKTEQVGTHLEREELAKIQGQKDA